MSGLDENSALAIVFANIRRKKRTNDLVTIAKSFEYLVSLYRSQKALAEKVGLSTEMIRQFLAILELPKEVQEIFHKRQLDSVDVAKELLALASPTKQIAAARAVADSLSKDIRDIKRLIKDTNISIKNAKKVILDAKPKGLHIFMMDFDDEMYRGIKKYAKSLHVKPAELIREIVVDWLKNKKRINKKKM